MYAATKEQNDLIFYADVILRVTEQEHLDEVALPFVEVLVDKILDKTEKLKTSGLCTEEALLRASVVQELYAGIKRKIENGRKEG